MRDTKLVVVGPLVSQEVVLDPAGMTMGRTAGCDIVLEDRNVSRQHARISQDPFGRWVIEDLNSHNGTLVDGQKIESKALRPYEKIAIDPFVMHLADLSDAEDLSAQPSGTGAEDVSYGTDRSLALSPVQFQNLNELRNDLLDVKDLSQLYTRAASRLARLLHALIAVVRVPASNPNPIEFPEILACCFGDGRAVDDENVNVPFSNRVLSAVRATDLPVKATGAADSEQDLSLTIVDSHIPHVVYAVRINHVGERLDVLYVDMPESQSSGAMLDFVELASRQVDYVQKNLYLVELEQKEQALREANKQLLQKDRIKDEYVSRITHDIKGHLAAIANSLYVASGEMGPQSSLVLKDFVQRAQKRTGLLTAFIKDLLDMTRMRLGGKLEMKPFSLPDSLAGVMADVGSHAKEKSITLRCDIHEAIGQVIGNELSLREVLANLVSNAVKYTPDGNAVNVRAIPLAEACFGDGTRGPAVQVAVSDTGIGIPSEDLDHVFDEFFRAKNARQGKEEGTGLGLSIVKTIVKLHNGTINVTSREGQGTTFTLTLPLDCRSDSAVPPLPQARRENGCTQWVEEHAPK